MVNDKLRFASVNLFDRRVETRNTFCDLKTSNVRLSDSKRVLQDLLVRTARSTFGILSQNSIIFLGLDRTHQTDRSTEVLFAEVCNKMFFYSNNIFVGGANFKFSISPFVLFLSHSLRDTLSALFSFFLSLFFFLVLFSFFLSPPFFIFSSLYSLPLVLFFSPRWADFSC